MSDIDKQQEQEAEVVHHHHTNNDKDNNMSSDFFISSLISFVLPLCIYQLSCACFKMDPHKKLTFFSPTEEADAYNKDYNDMSNMRFTTIIVVSCLVILICLCMSFYIHSTGAKTAVSGLINGSLITLIVSAWVYQNQLSPIFQVFICVLIVCILLVICCLFPKVLVSYQGK